MAREEHQLLTGTCDEGSYQGQFLIATPVIGSGFFNRSLTYLCHHDADGAMGIVINQHLDLALSDLLEHLDIETVSDLSDYQVLAGGPVGTEQGFVLHRGGPKWEGSRAVGEDLSLTTSRDILCALAVGDGPQDYLVALGYAGWGPGQLEEEVSGNSWLTVPADRRILFQVAADDKLAAAGQQLGIDIDLLTAQAGHA
ncbi:MAG: YqgE/AlgH family protein [Luminiphilus sp.]|jgi:putative transcriptional regulator